MSNKNKLMLTVVILIITLLPGCAKKDLVIDMGKGDAIHLVGEADSFECNDPTYAGVEKVPTWEMQFADGSSKHLCASKSSVSKRNPEPLTPLSAMKPQIASSGAIPIAARSNSAQPSMNFGAMPISPPSKQDRANGSDCDKQQVEAERRICRVKEIEKIDQALNERYQSLLSLLKDDSVARLKKAENTWIQFRDSTCTLEAEDILTGEAKLSASLKDYTISECKGRMTEQRVGEINTYLGALLKNPELHAIGVYEGPLHFGGKPVADPSASTINVHVHVRGRPVVLALFNYESVMWNIIADEGVVIKEIILSNYNGAKVTGLNDKAFKVSRQNIGLAYDSRTADNVSPKLREYTGLETKTFQSEYKAKEFSIGP